MKGITFEQVDYYKKKFKRILMGKYSGEGLIFKFAIYFLLICIGFIFLYPLFYIISLSIKNLDDLLDSTVMWIPREVYFENYKLALDIMGIPRKLTSYIRFESIKTNPIYMTLIVNGLPSITSTITTCIVGYGFSRFNFPMKKIWLFILIAIFIVPSQIILLPQFVWFKDMKILGTIWSYILPAIFGQGLNSSVFILIFYSFFNMIPKTLDEAAFLDGANEIGVFYKIGLRLSIQPIIIVFLFNFVWYWNDYYRASYFLTGSKWTTLPLELASFETKYKALMDGLDAQIKDIFEPQVMAGTIITIIPVLVIYFILQRYFVESIDRTGITGE